MCNALNMPIGFEEWLWFHEFNYYQIKQLKIPHLVLELLMERHNFHQDKVGTEYKIGKIYFKILDEIL